MKLYSQLLLQGLANIRIRVDALTNFTQRALNDHLRAIQALNTGQIQMRKTVIQHQMALDILTATQGGTCAIIKAGCPMNDAHTGS